MESINRECVERMLTEMASQVRQSTTDNMVAVSLNSGAAALDAFADTIERSEPRIAEMARQFADGLRSPTTAEELRSRFP